MASEYRRAIEGRDYGGSAVFYLTKRHAPFEELQPWEQRNVASGSPRHAILNDGVHRREYAEVPVDRSNELSYLR